MSDPMIPQYDVMVTTEDNPFDPFDEFDDWDMFDTSHGYNTLSYIARIAVHSEDLPEETNRAEWEKACDEICYYNLTGNYVRVKKKIED